MAQVIMPKMGDAMEEGTLLKWLKNPGDEVAEGDPIAEIETDKVTLEIEAAEDGFLTQTMVNEGDVVPIGTTIAMIGAEDEVGQAPPAEAAAQPAAAPAEEPPAEMAQEPQQAATVPSAQPEAAAISAPPEAPAATPPATNGRGNGQVVERRPGERLRASPLVKRLAAEHGIDLARVAGSGPGGRIIKDDLKDYISGAKPAPQAPAAAPEAAPAAPQPAQTAPAVTAAPKGAPAELSKIKARTGERMSLSKQTIPHYYVTSNVDMTEALAFRAQVNASLGENGVRVSVNDLIVKAAALALREHPQVNRSFENGQLFDHDSIDVNIAIALEGGLIAPFIPHADEKSLGTIARMTKDLGRRAREGGLTPNEYQGGTFTISNLGMFDVAEFIAVINPPQAAILAIGSVTPTPVIQDGEVVVGQVMKITLSADHRVLDGAEVATFLQAVKRYLEHPMLLAVS